MLLKSAILFLAAMAIILVAAVAITYWAEAAGTPMLRDSSLSTPLSSIQLLTSGRNGARAYQ